MKKGGVLFSFIGAMVLVLISSCSGDKPASENQEIKEALKVESVEYPADSSTQKGFVAYNESGKKMPVILIVHEWWGLNDYTKNRAKQLAELGYFAFAVDMYGNGKIANNPEEAGAAAGPFYANSEMANARIEAALEKIKASYPQADLNNVVAIGYCFGGSMVLNAAKSGMPFKGVVSFHGGLAGVKPQKNKTKAAVLVCHGASDQFVSNDEVNQFKKEMDSVGTKYQFISYPNATHAFTNPGSTANGKRFNIPIAYNKEADEKSWKDFMKFLKELKM